MCLMFPKPTKKKKRKKHPKSILQSDKNICYLCAMKGDYSEKFTHEHHIVFGGGGRPKSEEYGLKVYLCPEHHSQDDPESPHCSKEVREFLCRKAQEAFERTHTHEEWMAIAGKNYL